MKPHYVIGDATQPSGGNEGMVVIVQICNDSGAYGAGFSGAVGRKWPRVKREFKEWSRNFHQLGQVQTVMVSTDPEIVVANLIGQHGIGMKDGPPIRYDAVRNGLKNIAEYCRVENATVHMPRIGCGLAGGKWEEIEPIIQEELCDKGIHVTVYDLACHANLNQQSGH